MNNPKIPYPISRTSIFEGKDLDKQKKIVNFATDFKKEQTSDYYEAFTTTIYPDGADDIGPTGCHSPERKPSERRLWIPILSYE
jgi:hypothetical protein